MFKAQYALRSLLLLWALTQNAGAADTHVQQQALALLQQVYDLEESILIPDKDQLFVMFDKEMGAAILVERIEVFLDEQLVTNRVFSTADLLKFMDRGIAPISARLVPPGEHRLKILLHSMNQPVISSELQFHKGSSPQFIRLNLLNNKVELLNWSGR
ncbi:hypothetical protein [Shewanella cyperi]|uniref:Uncharacterized protein n=1 Tax=Shewanella cyperi TaxID=2814292 RepID=A0A974XM26_9GAMM|nr:hypothetical protein [Shewanella cyperi]QSX30920.1 hypothetical protein JYB88_04535 [Shewanella cyperi]QSX41699.1 hypothetical protein JYB84_04555 [Shewanella cyperi]